MSGNTTTRSVEPTEDEMTRAVEHEVQAAESNGQHLRANLLRDLLVAWYVGDVSKKALYVAVIGVQMDENAELAEYIANWVETQ
jgi:hypothetical protein